MMKTGCERLVGLLVVVLVVAGVGRVEGGEREAGGVAKLVCDEAKWDFGRADNLDVVRHAFRIRNEGDGWLVIKGIRSSCGCTVAGVSSRRIKPGGEAIVSVELLLARKKGRVRESVLVESNDPNRPFVRLDVEGMAVETVEIAPYPVLFHQVPNDAASTVVIEIKRVDGGSLSVRGVGTDLPQLEAEAERVADGRYRVEIRTKPPLPAGPLRGSVQVAVDGERARVIRIPVVMTAVQELAVSPTEIVLIDRGKANGPAKRFVIVAPGKVKEFRITSVDTPVASIQAEVMAGERGGYIVQVSNLMPDRELHGKEVRIRTDVEQMRIIRIPIRVVGEEGA